MNAQRLLGLRMQVLAILATIDAEIAADDELAASQDSGDDDMMHVQTMGQSDDGLSYG